MPRITYQEKKFRPVALHTIAYANKIIEEYSQQGFNLNLRQLYYQFVSRDLIPNTLASYKRLGSVVNDARLAGLIDWSAIEDRTRHTNVPPSWPSPASIIRSAARSFQLDKWVDQSYRPEVWIEKEALAGIIEPICDELNIPHLSCRGYTSQSEMWRSGRRLLHNLNNDQTPIILHFGDHDPSGLDMTRDITDRLSLFMGGVEVKRLALNMDQIERLKPPPNPAKVTDSRFRAYVLEYGESSWELDALEPKILTDLIRDHVWALRDDAKWAAKLEEEEDQTTHLTLMADHWEDAIRLLLQDRGE